MFGFGFAEIILITALALIVIGPKRLPEVARAVGKGFSEFKGALDEVKRSVQQEVHKPMMDAKSEYLDQLLAERAKADNDTKAKTQGGPPPDTDATMGAPDEQTFSDLPYKKTDDNAEGEGEELKTSAQATGPDGDEKA